VVTKSSDKTVKLDELALKNIIQGAQAVLVNNKTVAFRGGTLTGAQVVQAAQTMLAPYLVVDTDRTKLKQDVQTRNANDPTVNQWVADFKSGCNTTFGETSVEFGQFGFTPRKAPTPLTPEQKQLRTARLRATRSVRNTLGRVQKKAVKGQVAAPGSSASSPAPAQPAPTGTNGTTASSATASSTK
jgi:hypothetical protein